MQVAKYESEKLQTSILTKEVIKSELMICSKFLEKDERNFHAWNYRSYIVRFFVDWFPEEKIQVMKDELAYLDDKLNKNFSNFSALHFRGKYIVQ